MTCMGQSYRMKEYYGRNIFSTKSRERENYRKVTICEIHIERNCTPKIQTSAPKNFTHKLHTFNTERSVKREKYD